MVSLRPVVILLVASLFPLASANPAADPVVNGGFEINVSLGDTVPATCIGVGHQVFYGSETIQADLLTRNDANAAATRATADPSGQALFTAGVGHCVSNSRQGFDLAWVSPSATVNKPVGWSHDLSTSTSWADVDGDGDTEAIIGANKQISGHNMWQSYASPHQAWTADFQSLGFRVENGAPMTGAVVVSLSAVPLHKTNTSVVTGIDCQLTFSKTLLTAHRAADGTVAVDPALAAFSSRTSDCADLAAAWTGADAAGRHAILAKLRLVQLSFWNFNTGATAIVIDDVSLAGARSVAHAALG